MSAFAQDGQHEGGFWKKLGRRVTPQIQVVNPLHYVSYEDQGHVMTIKNGTRLFCKVVAYGSVITLDDEGRPSPLAPAEGVADVRHYEPLSPSIPLVAQCYENASMETYAGTATHTLQLNPGNPEALEWTIQESEVETPQGQSASGTLRPTPDANFAIRKINLPRIWWNATGGIQIVNNTLFEVRVTVNNRLVAQLSPRDIFFRETRLVVGVGVNQTIHLDFVDRGRLIGTLDDQIFVPENGIFVRQLIVSNNSIRQVGQ